MVSLKLRLSVKLPAGDVAAEGGRKTRQNDLSELNEGGLVQHHVDVDKQPTYYDVNVANPYGPYGNREANGNFQRLCLLQPASTSDRGNDRGRGRGRGSAP